MSSLTPREIVAELDKHIIGQDAAKRAVSIALRNRWRRMQVGELVETLGIAVHEGANPNAPSSLRSRRHTSRVAPGSGHI